jgi:pyruvate dehydrogenase E1 component alpha subunit
VHPSIGQEAVAAGVCAALDPDDRIVSTHRGHGHAIAKGARLDRMTAELLGRATGYCRGRGGSMHLAAPEVGLLGANGIVAAGMPIAAGAALAIQLDGSDAVTVGFFGDRSTTEGVFHEAMNISALWHLPVVWVCETNQASADDTLAVGNVAALGAAYGMPAATVDGNDVLAVREATSAATGRARPGEGPTLLDMRTFRMATHAMWRGAPVDPRPPAELEAWAERDPIARLCRRVAALGDAHALDRIEAEVRSALDEAVAFALASPYPDPETVLDDVFAP